MNTFLKLGAFKERRFQQHTRKLDYYLKKTAVKSKDLATKNQNIFSWGLNTPAR